MRCSCLWRGTLVAALWRAFRQCRAGRAKTHLSLVSLFERYECTRGFPIHAIHCSVSAELMTRPSQHDHGVRSMCVALSPHSSLGTIDQATACSCQLTQCCNTIGGGPSGIARAVYPKKRSALSLAHEVEELPVEQETAAASGTRNSSGESVNRRGSIHPSFV